MRVKFLQKYISRFTLDMTTAGLEPATFWYAQQSKPNALPLRQVAMVHRSINDVTSTGSPSHHSMLSSSSFHRDSMNIEYHNNITSFSALFVGSRIIGIGKAASREHPQSWLSANQYYLTVCTAHYPAAKLANSGAVTGCQAPNIIAS